MDNVVSLSDAGSPRVVGIPTGFNDLDLFTSGFQSGSLVIVAGSSNSGKTIFAINIAKHVACTEGLPVLIFSPNESATQITNRFLGVISKIAQYKFRNAAFTNADWLVYVEAIERLRNATIAIDDTSRLTFEKIEIECRNRLHLHGALGLVVIDSVQHIDPSNNEPNDSIGIYRKIKSLAREINSTILLISDISESTKTRKDKQPILHDLNGGDLFADLILFTHKYPAPNEQSPGDIAWLDVKVAKQKDGGPLGMVKLFLDNSCGTINDFQF